MRQFSVMEMSWLERPGDDFRSRVRSLSGAEGRVDAAELVDLAKTYLNVDQLAQLSRALERVGDRLDAPALAPVKLALLLDGTVDYFTSSIPATALRHRLLVKTYAPAYGQALPEALSSEPFGGFAPDVALIASDYRSLGLSSPCMTAEDRDRAVAGAIAKIGQLVEAVHRHGISIILQTVAAPSDAWCGHLDRSLPGAPSSMVAAVNDAIRGYAQSHSATIFDADALAGVVGRGTWFDPAYWHRAKLPFTLDLLPLWSDHLCRIIGALRGKSRKCLVLDLDNTCWGGVIGDDGLEGISLGQGSANGEAYLAIQAYALSLKARGIVLAVVSKNEDDAARLPFREHPDMLLKEDDIAVFLANWDDKATNIKHVAQRLNIGLDALAFLDDNPAERTRVRQQLPEVAVPEVPEDPSDYPAILAQSGLFETVALSEDDARRAEQYRQNASRSVALEKIGDYDEYLRTLAMTCELRPFDAVGRSRIAQLVNKSNQFNLTTRRYTEADIARFEADPAKFSLQVRLTDTFGDNGMISVILFERGAEEWVCDTWLMSCRVLGRRVEEAVLDTVVTAARNAGARRLVGDYIPSPKNRMVAEHFAKLGFRPGGTTPGTADGTRWVLDLETYAKKELPLEIVFEGRTVPSAA